MLKDQYTKPITFLHTINKTLEILKKQNIQLRKIHQVPRNKSKVVRNLYTKIYLKIAAKNVKRNKCRNI